MADSAARFASSAASVQRYAWSQFSPLICSTAMPKSYRLSQPRRWSSAMQMRLSDSRRALSPSMSSAAVRQAWT